MQNPISRRALINQALMVAALIPAARIGTANAAGALVPLDPNDPAAKSLGYSSDSSKVDAAAYATHKADQTCTNCVQYQGKAGDAAGGCGVFPGKSVAAKGWCKVWAKKPGT